ncbi:MAG: RsmB/NOP family class I SAM-dependent RNA methyltransferase [Proteobacteria bacterium]|nr:RsmB/NOP family class I SAM-dependent RNA methyltransferase [Pseudomonadota bacterium]
MTPGARLAAAAEVLDRIAASRAPAEQVLKEWGRANRYAGSGDRRAIGELVFRCLRNRARLADAGGAEDGRTLVLWSLRLLDGRDPEEIERLFSGAGYAPAALSDAERTRLSAMKVGAEASLPGFVEADFRRRFGANWAREAEALIATRAPVDVRVNGGDREAVAGELRAARLAAQETPWSAWGLRLPAGSDVQGTVAWREGRVEVQDEGSQLAAGLAGSRPRELVVDYCAGGGGKTLALAQSGARVIACDVQSRRLDAVRPRLERANAEAELRLLGPEGEGVADLEERADLVFVDAPCSGAGTWRRRPEAAWRLTEAEVDRFHGLQVAILGRAAKLVRPGGRLVYVTCSVLGRENEDSAAAFAGAHGAFRPVAVAEAAAHASGLTEAGRARLAELAGGGHQVQFTPARTGTDGFFVALWKRTS